MATELFSYLNHGRWVVDCTGCATAFLEGKVPPECPSCGTVLGRVKAPSDKERQHIMDVVSTRKVENQNWEPGEDIDYLVADNIAHAVADA